MIAPIQIFEPGSVTGTQDMLFVLAEYISANITISNISNQLSTLQAIQQTLINMISIIDAYQIQTLMTQEDSTLINVSGILPNLSSQDQILINNRLASVSSLVNTINPIPIVITFDVNQLTLGQPAVQTYDLLSYFANFNYESTPPGLDNTNFQIQAQNMATAWADALDYLSMSGTQFQLTSYNAVDRMAACSQLVADFINNLVISSSFNNIEYATIADVPDMALLISIDPLIAANPNIPNLWNTLVALPTILRVAGLLYNDPSSQQSQSINVLKYTILNLLLLTNATISLFIAPNNLVQPATAVLRAGETLLDFAVRTTGDYTQWTIIATANNLVPPYVGTVPQIGIAVPGQSLYLPPFSGSNPVAEYNDFYLGTDINLGLPGTTLEIWAGDFSLISGLNNYLSALQRRILTTYGSLIYHPSYGSLLPPQVGNVTTSNEAIFLSTYLKSALLADPRTQQVNAITAYPVQFGAIALTAQVQPWGSSKSSPSSIYIIPQSIDTTTQ